jgi:hypothetical protein
MFDGHTMTDGELLQSEPVDHEFSPPPLIHMKRVISMPRLLQCFAFLATAIMATTVAADNIIDEHLKAVGGAENLAKIKTIQREGKVSLTGPFGAFEGALSEAYDLADSKGHRLMDLAIFRIESAWTGDAGWQDGPPNGIRDMNAEELAMAKMNGAASLVAALAKEHGAEGFEAPTDETFNEQECAYVKVKESPLALYINKETKLLEGLSVDGKVTITFDDYQEIDGVQFAKKATTNIAEPPITLVNEYEETKLNEELDESIFAKPELAVEEEEEEEEAAATP